MIPGITLAPTVIASFAASFVEFVEALTVVLAAGSVRGWRSALPGALAGVSILAGLVAALGPFLAHINLPAVQLVIGLMVLLFGLRWTRKAILRSAGLIPLHDEVAVYAKAKGKLEASAPGRRLDIPCFATCLNIVLLEGLEVVFIVISMSVHSGLRGPVIGAAAALVIVCLLGVALHRPLRMVPENQLKFLVGLMLTSFGTFWAGEGLGLTWLFDDLSLPLLFVGYFILSWTLVAIARYRNRGIDQ